MRHPSLASFACLAVLACVLPSLSRVSPYRACIAWLLAQPFSPSFTYCTSTHHPTHPLAQSLSPLCMQFAKCSLDREENSGRLWWLPGSSLQNMTQASQDIRHLGEPQTIGIWRSLFSNSLPSSPLVLSICAVQDRLAQSPCGWPNWISCTTASDFDNCFSTCRKRKTQSHRHAR